MEVSALERKIKTVELMESLSYTGLELDLRRITQHAIKFILTSREHVKECAYAILSKIEDFYKDSALKVPIYARNEFEPIIQLSDIIKGFRKTLERIFEDGKKEEIDILTTYAHVILGLNSIFNARLSLYKEDVKPVLGISGVPSISVLKNYLIDPNEIRKLPIANDY